jgi:hypothetical protein
MSDLKKFREQVRSELRGAVVASKDLANREIAALKDEFRTKREESLANHKERAKALRREAKAKSDAFKEQREA